MFPSSSLIDLAKSHAWEEVRRHLQTLPLLRRAVEEEEEEEPPNKMPPKTAEMSEVPREVLAVALLDEDIPDDIVPLLLKHRERRGGHGQEGFPRVVDTGEEVTFEETVLVHICGFLPRRPIEHPSPRSKKEPRRDPVLIASGWETFLRESSPASIEALLDVYSANYCSGRLRPEKVNDEEDGSSSSPLSSARASKWVGQLLERHFARDLDDRDREFYIYEQKLCDLDYITSMDELREDVPDLYDIWRKAELLLKFRHVTTGCGSGGKPPDSSSPFKLTPHQFLQNRYPLVLIWLYGRMFPEQFRQRDDRGRIPLHWAYLAEGHKIAPSQRAGLTFPWPDLACLNSTNATQIVSNIYPWGASCHDDGGRLPLTTHIVEGGLWQTDLNDLRHMIKQAPRILQTRDAETGFFPFMLAASSLRVEAAPAAVRQDDGHRDAFCASVIYVLLRENPAILTLLRVCSGATCTAAEEPVAAPREEGN